MFYLFASIWIKGPSNNLFCFGFTPVNTQLLIHIYDLYFYSLRSLLVFKAANYIFFILIDVLVHLADEISYALSNSICLFSYITLINMYPYFSFLL